MTKENHGNKGYLSDNTDRMRNESERTESRDFDPGTTAEDVARLGGESLVLRATDEDPTPSTDQENKSLELDNSYDDATSSVSRNLNNVTQEEANITTGKGGVRNKDDMGS